MSDKPMELNDPLCLEQWAVAEHSPLWLVIDTGAKTKDGHALVYSAMSHLAPAPDAPCRDELVKRGVDRVKLAAAAPALVRALLAAEWYPENWSVGPTDSPTREFQGPWCPVCEAEVGNPFPGDRKHQPDCTTELALKAAGLPDQASRDAAREMMRGKT